VFNVKGSDNTLARERVKQMRAFICEYDLLKAKKHPHFRFASDLFKARGIKKQNFFKYYHRRDSSDESLLPRRRGGGDRHKIYPAVSNAVVRFRRQGLSRFEIHRRLEPVLKRLTPSESTIYNIIRRSALNRLRPEQKRCRRMIIKDKAGELGHFDCYHLPRGLVKDAGKLYLIGGIDDATRVAWVEVMPDITALSAMFGCMQILRVMESHYGIRMQAVMTDNGAEFRNSTNPMKHPFERLLVMLETKHYYTKPYKPQSNGKIERFWRTLYEDLLEEAEFESVEKFRDELQEYMLYYNEVRPHSSLGNKTPRAVADQKCQRLS
jgi:IS30 family transposase